MSESKVMTHFMGNSHIRTNDTAIRPLQNKQNVHKSEHSDFKMMVSFYANGTEYNLRRTSMCGFH